VSEFSLAFRSLGCVSWKFLGYVYIVVGFYDFRIRLLTIISDILVAEKCKSGRTPREILHFSIQKKNVTTFFDFLLN
jgi:hypothetical protein